MERMTVREFRALGVKTVKYANTKNVIDHIRFDSKLEASRYLALKNLWTMGAVRWFTRQVPFHLPGGIVYRADFLVCWAPTSTTKHDTLSIEDCKGFMTRVAINKIKQVESIYGFKVQIIQRESRARGRNRTRGV